MGDILARAMLKAEKKLERSMQGAVLANDKDSEIQQHTGDSAKEKISDYHLDPSMANYPSTEGVLNNRYEQEKTDTSHEIIDGSSIHHKAQARGKSMLKKHSKNDRKENFSHEEWRSGKSNKLVQKGSKQHHHSSKIRNDKQNAETVGGDVAKISAEKGKEVGNKDYVTQFNNSDEEKLYEDYERNARKQHGKFGKRGRSHG